MPHVSVSLTCLAQREGRGEGGGVISVIGYHITYHVKKIKGLSWGYHGAIRLRERERERVNSSVIKVRISFRLDA